MACTIKFKDGTEMSEAEFYAWAMDNIDLKEFAKTGNAIFINKKEQAAQFSAIKKLAYNLQKGFQALFGSKVEIITDTEEIDRVLAGDRKNIKMQIDGKEVTVKPMSLEVVNGFYSPIEKTLMSFGKNTQKAKEWLNVVGKSDEAVFTGVRDFIESKDPNSMLSKQEILDYMKDNRIEIVEVVKEQATKIGNTKYSQYQLEGEKENYKEVLVTLPSKTKSIDDISVDLYGVPYSQLITEYPNSFQSRQNRVNEVYKKTVESGQGGKQFKSTHFDEPNILVHLRMNTRTDADGNKVLFLEEVQSDWGQEGKRRGFEKPENTQAIKELENEKQKVLESSKSYQLLNGNTEGNLSVEVFDAIQQKATNMIDNQYSTEESRKERFLEEIENTLNYWSRNNEVPKMTQEELSDFYDVYIKELENNSKKITGYDTSYRLASLENKIEDIDKKIFDNFWEKEGISTAPFVMDTNAWTKLGLKVALKEAVAQGVDKIAWTTGEQQNDRYDLSKQVGSIIYDKNKDGTFHVSATRPKFIATSVENAGSNFLFNEYKIDAKRIEDVFGKDIANKIINNEGELDEEDGYTTLKGNDLKMGGKGMKGFYGSMEEGTKGIVGGVAEKLFGQKIGKVKFSSPKNKEVIDAYNKARSYGNIPQALADKYELAKGLESTQQSIDITPELKTQVAEGQPMFMRDPKGKVLGFVYEGKIYIDPRTASPTTPIHEFGHMWNQYMKENHKAFYNRGIKLIKEEGGAYIEKVKKLYPELAEKGREADLYEEALAQAIGDKGALLAKQDQPSFLSWLKDMWKLVKDGLKLSVSAEALSKMTLNDYTNLVAGSMLKGAEIATLLKAERTSQASTNPKFVKNAVKNLIATKDKVTVALSKLMGQLYKAESKGYANAVRTMKAREAAKKEFQAAAENFLKERGIPITAEIKIEIAKIKDELSYANTMMKLIDMDNAGIRLIQIGRIKKLVKELKKLKKNKSKLTSSDINFIRDTEFPSPYEISDLDGYEKVLGDLISSLSSQTVLGVKNRFDNFIQQEAEYIKAYKEAIAEIKKMIQTAEWKEEYKQLKESGMFEGTDITSENDWIDLKESLGNIDKAEKAQERLDSLEEKFNENTKLLAEMKAATKELMESNKKELVESFKDFNDTSTPLSYDQIYNLIDSLGYNQLVKLGNIIDNVLNDYDFTGIGDYASLGRLNAKSDSLFKQLAGRVMRGVKIDPAKKMSIQQLISEISYAGDSINKALDFILGDWNSMISRVKKVYDKVFSDYEGLKNALADKNDKNKKDAIFKSTVRIDTFAFINQWFKSDTEEQQNAHLRDRVKAIADQHIRFLKNFRLPNPSLSDKIRIKKATEGLKALQEFGVIEDLDLENLTYKLNEGTTKEALQGKLNSKELKLYDYLINTFKRLSNFQNAMAMNMNKPYDEVENYFPTFPKKIDSSVEQASIEDMKAAFQRISKSNARAKGRSRQIANGKYEYNSGLTENFSKGYWEALMIDLGSNQMLDMSNMINSKFGLQKLTEAGLTPQVISIIKERLNEKATTDVAYGNINTNVDNAVSLEFERAFNNGVIGMILKNPKQMLKQGVAPFLTNLIMKPKSSAKAVEMLLKGGRYAKAVDNLLDKSTIQSRLILYQLNPVDLGVPAEYMLEEGKKRFATLKKTQEVQERWGDLVYPILKKIGVYKGNYTNLLASTDAYVSKMNILTGYIDHQMKKGKTIEQIIKDLEENKIDSVSLQNAERWQSDMNAESVRSNVAPMLRQNSGGWKYFMKTFPFTTHQSFKQGVRKIMELKSEELSGDEKRDLFDMIAKFAVQQILYRATVDVGITLIAMAIEKGLSDDEDDEYFWNELLSKSGGQFLFDLAFGSKSIMADVGYAIALNIAWKAWASSELEKRQSEEVGFKSKALEGNLMIEPQMGGVSGVVGREAGKVYSKLEKGFKKQEPWSDIAFQTSIGIVPPVTSIVFGSGSVRQALNAFQSREEKEYRMSNLLDAKLATEIPDFAFSVSDDNRKGIIEMLRSRDYNEAKSSLFISEGIDGKNKLFLIPKESYKKLQQDALIGLFGTASTSVETIAKSKKAATLSDEKIKNFAEKYKLSNKDYKFIKVSYGNRVLDADAIKSLVSQMVSKIAKEDVLKRRDRKYSIYTYKLEK